MNQKSFFSSLLILFVAAFATLPLCAQETTIDPPIAYGYNHTIEAMAGNVQNLKSYAQLPDQGIALLNHDDLGANLSLRYSHFFTRHWGAYAQLDAFFLEGYSLDMQAPLSECYNHGSKEVRITCDFDDLSQGISSSHGMYLFGAVYRYDIGKWSFRSRVGIGKIHQHSSRSRFYVVDTHAEHDYEQFTLSTTDSDGRFVRRLNAFAYAPAIQITFTPRRHFFFSTELQWTGTIGHFYQQTRIDQYRTTEPQDWQAESDQYFYIVGPSEYVKRVGMHSERVQMGNFLQFRIGIGWNIGHNRNAR